MGDLGERVEKGGKEKKETFLEGRELGGKVSSER